jgi:hypothetical protein
VFEVREVEVTKVIAKELPEFVRVRKKKGGLAKL